MTSGHRRRRHACGGSRGVPALFPTFSSPLSSRLQCQSLSATSCSASSAAASQPRMHCIQPRGSATPLSPPLPPPPPATSAPARAPAKPARLAQQPPGLRAQQGGNSGRLLGAAYFMLALQRGTCLKAQPTHPLPPSPHTTPDGRPHSLNIGLGWQRRWPAPTTLLLHQCLQQWAACC